MTDTFTQTDRTTATPASRPGLSYERATAYAILDEAYHCHLGFVRRRRAPGAADPARARRRHALPARLHRVTAAAGRPRPTACRSASP